MKKNIICVISTVVMAVAVCFSGAVNNATNVQAKLVDAGELGDIDESGGDGEEFDLGNLTETTTKNDADTSTENTTDTQETTTSYLSISKAGFSYAKTKVYTGKAIKPAVTVKYNGVKLVKGTDYKVSYSNNKNTGVATIKVTGIGKYTGTKNLKFKIKPAKVAKKKITSTKKGKVTLKWKKAAGAVTGYQITYAKNAKFKNAKSVKVAKATKISNTIKNLKSGKKYYFKIRAYKKTSSGTLYGAYVSYGSIKVK